MELFRIKDYSNEWILEINHVKYIIGDNLDSRYRLNRTIRHYLQKEEKSIYENECENQVLFEVNGKRVDPRIWKIYTISDGSDLDIDLKLGAKTITLDYLESKLMNIEYDENFIGVNQQLFAFNQEVMTRCDLSSNDVELTFGFEELTVRSLIKSLVPMLQKEEEQSKDYDLSIYEKISLYIQMIKAIAESNSDKEFLVILNCGLVSSRIIQTIDSLRLKNIRIIIFTNNFSTNIDFRDVYYLGNINLDFGNNQELYDKLVLNYGIAEDLETLSNRLNLAFDHRNKIEMTKILLKLV